MRRLPLCLLFLTILSGCAQPETSFPTSPGGGPVPVIMISLDGFRNDYLYQGDTPTLDHLADTGAVADMHPSFPSVTFPNHYTLVTGLRPDMHGIVGNRMLDPAIPDEIFDVSRGTGLQDPRWWDGAEPVWVTAETHGLHAASMFWPGTDTPIKGVLPDDWAHYDKTLSADDRITRVLGWFQRPVAERPVLTTIYLEDVDHAGHSDGPNSKARHAAAATVDHAVGMLLDGLRQNHIIANIIIVSDHGMAQISPHRAIPLSRLAPVGEMEIVTSGAYAGINPTPGHERSLADALAKPHDHVQCWPKDHIPERLHYGRNARVPAFICLADVGWVLTGPRDTHPVHGGAHGYDPAAPEMTAIFIGNGPAFARGTKLAPINNTDIQPLVLHLLGLVGQTGDGTFRDLRAALTPAYADLQ